MSRKGQRFLLEADRTFPDRVFIPVPWKRASWLRDRLRERGLQTTICYEPADRSAGLEFRPGTDRDVVHQALRELGNVPSELAS